MYGTVARMKVLPGALKLLKKVEQRRPAGFIGSYIYEMDDNPGELWMVVMFESKEAYFLNANSVEQNQEYLQIRNLLVEDPEWHDGFIVFDSNKDLL